MKYICIYNKITGKTYLAHTIYQLLNLDHDKLPGDKQSSPAFISQSIGGLLRAERCQVNYFFLRTKTFWQYQKIFLTKNRKQHKNKQKEFFEKFKARHKRVIKGFEDLNELETLLQ